MRVFVLETESVYTQSFATEESLKQLDVTKQERCEIILVSKEWNSQTNQNCRNKMHQQYLDASIKADNYD